MHTFFSLFGPVIKLYMITFFSFHLRAKRKIGIILARLMRANRCNPTSMLWYVLGHCKY